MEPHYTTWIMAAQQEIGPEIYIYPSGFTQKLFVFCTAEGGRNPNSDRFRNAEWDEYYKRLG
jgi:hypothetical protein